MGRRANRRLRHFRRDRLQSAEHTWYRGHPYGPKCQRKQLLVNFWHSGQSSGHLRLRRHYQLDVCACRSVKYVWDLFVMQVNVARINTLSGPPIAVDPVSKGYYRIRLDATIATEFNPCYPVWAFAVTPSRSSVGLHLHRHNGQFKRGGVHHQHRHNHRRFQPQRRRRHRRKRGITSSPCKMM